MLGDFLTKDILRFAKPEPTFGEAVETAASDAFEQNPTKVAIDIFQIPDDNPEQRRRLTNEELMARTKQDGLSAAFSFLPTEAEYQAKLQFYEERRKNAEILGRVQSTSGQIGSVIGSFVGASADPLNFVGVGGGLALRATTTLLPRIATNSYRATALRYGIENAVTTTALAPLYAAAAGYKGYEYGVGDFAVDLAASAILGAGIGVAAKPVGDFIDRRQLQAQLFGDANIDIDAYFNQPKPIEALGFSATLEQKAQLLDSAAFQLAHFGTVNVEPAIQAEVNRLFSAFNFSSITSRAAETPLNAEAVARVVSNLSFDQRANGFAVAPLIRDGEQVRAATKQEARELARGLNQSGEAVRRNITFVERNGQYDLFETVDISVDFQKRYNTVTAATKDGYGRDDLIKIDTERVKNKRGDTEKISQYIPARGLSPEVIATIRARPSDLTVFTPKPVRSISAARNSGALSDPAALPQTPAAENVFSSVMDYKIYPAAQRFSAPEAVRETAEEVDAALDLAETEYETILRQRGEQPEARESTEELAVAERTASRFQEYVDCLLRI